MSKVLRRRRIYSTLSDIPIPTRASMGRENFSGGGVERHMVKTKGITFVQTPTIELDRDLSLENRIELFFFSSSSSSFSPV